MMTKKSKIPFLSMLSIASLLVMSIVTYGSVFASNGNEEENGNGNGEQCDCPSNVEVIVNGTDEDGGNQTEDIPDDEIIIIDDPATNQTGNQSAPMNQTGNTNTTGPVITEPKNEPQTKPTAINLAIIDSIQRGHQQHIFPFVTDEQGNEFENETVVITVMTNPPKAFVADSGEDVPFKVGSNTSPRTIDVKAALESNPEIFTVGEYYVFPKGSPPTEQPTNQTTEPAPLPPVNETQPQPPQNETIPVPTVNQTQGSNETDVETPFNVTLPNSTFG
jgi:hypothetical protein